MAQTKETKLILALNRYNELKRVQETEYQKKYDDFRRFGEYEKIAELNYNNIEELDAIERGYIQTIFKIFEED